MPKLAYEPLTEPTLTCEKVFSVQPIYNLFVFRLIQELRITD